MKIRVSAIVAMARNRVIGRENRLPWHLSEDLKYFKRVTLGKPIITGRKNHESIGRLLPGRLNILVTRQKGFEVPGARVVHSVEEALQVATEEARRIGVDEVFVIGGGEIYAQAMGACERLYVTEVERDVEGDVFFPEVPPVFREISREHREADGWAWDWVVLERDRL
jgi:dihydrofolate reductase